MDGSWCEFGEIIATTVAPGSSLQFFEFSRACTKLLLVGGTFELRCGRHRFRCGLL